MSGNTLYKTQTRNDQAEKTLKHFTFILILSMMDARFRDF